MIGVIARKIGMSRVFLSTGEAVPVTYLQVEDNTVVRTKTKDKDGYDALVLGVDESKMKTRKGKEHTRLDTQKEFMVELLDGYEPGAKVTTAVLPVDSMVTISSVSKGKGFQGVMKRYHFSGGPASHGSHFKREPGSVGMRTWPGRIHPGKRMAGRMGGDRITIKNRSVVVCDEAARIIGIKGPVPGPNGGLVYVTLESAPATR